MRGNACAWHLFCQPPWFIPKDFGGVRVDHELVRSRWKLSTVHDGRLSAVRGSRARSGVKIEDCEEHEKEHEKEHEEEQEEEWWSTRYVRRSTRNMRRSVRSVRSMRRMRRSVRSMRRSVRSMRRSVRR